MFTLDNSMDYSSSMKKRSSLYNLLFGVGIVSVITGLFLTLQFSRNISVTSGNVGVIITVLGLGVGMLFHEFTHEKRIFGLFVGFYALTIGFIIMFAGAGTAFVTYSQIWPFFVIAFAICFTIAGLISRKRFHAFFTVPSIILMVLGCLFLLFSFDIITESFAHFAARWWPVLLIIAGISLIILFYRRQHFPPTDPVFFEDDDEQQDVDDYLAY